MSNQEKGEWLGRRKVDWNKDNTLLPAEDCSISTQDNQRLEPSQTSNKKGKQINIANPNS